MNVSTDYAITQYLLKTLSDLKVRIIHNMEAAGQVVSGKTKDSMQIISDQPNQARLMARGYFAALETGSQPWKYTHIKYRKDGSTFPSAPRWFIDIIDQWIRDKGLTLNSWAVATKIMTDGSSLYRSGGRKDIFSVEIAKTMQDLGVEVAHLYEREVDNLFKEGQYRTTYPNQ